MSSSGAGPYSIVSKILATVLSPAAPATTFPAMSLLVTDCVRSLEFVTEAMEEYLGFITEEKVYNFHVIKHLFTIIDIKIIIY